MESPSPSIDGKPLLNITENGLKIKKKSTLAAFCSKHGLVVPQNEGRERHYKADYVASILHFKQGLQSPKEENKALTVASRRYEPRARRKTEKALAAEQESETRQGRIAGGDVASRTEGVNYEPRKRRKTEVFGTEQELTRQRSVSASNRLKRSADELVQSTAKRMKILAIQEVAQGDVNMHEQHSTSNSCPVPNIPSMPRTFSWINYTVTPTEGEGTHDATDNKGDTSVPREMKWIYQAKAPTRARLAGRGAKSGTISASVARVLPAADELVGVRIYLQVTDMDHILEAQVRRGPRREVKLDEIREQLHLKGDCHLIDPNNNKPFYPYNGSIIDGDDVDDMKDAQNYLRIMCRNADFAESDLGIVNHLKETPMVL